MHRLDTLGRLTLSREGAPVLSGRRKILALLAFLAAQPRRAFARDFLADQFWPDSDESRARQSLRTCLTELRAVLGSAVLVDGESVALADGAVAMDSATFERDVMEGRLGEAVSRWHGTFLPGLETIGGEGWRAWLEGERVRLLRRYAWALEHLTAAQERAGDLAAAVATAERWSADFPEDERAAVRLVSLLRAAGRPSDVAAVHAALAARIAGATGAPPSAAFRRLAPAGEPARDVRPGRRGLLTPDLVGRDDDVAHLLSAWGEVREGAARCVLVVGDEGLGKSRLLEDAGRLLADGADGPLILHGRVFPSERERPLAAVQPLLDQLAHAPGLAAVSAGALFTLGTVSRAIHEALPAPAAPLRPLPETVLEALAEVAYEAPVALLLDDAPWADAASQAVIEALARRTPAGVLLLLSGRPDAWAAWAPARELEAQPQVSRLSLGALTPPEAQQLIASVAPMDPATSRALAGRLHPETGGRPGLLQLVLGELAEQGTLRPDASGRWGLAVDASSLVLPVPAAVGDRVRHRVAALPDLSRRVLDAAAVLGPRLDSDVLERVSRVRAAQFRTAVTDLLARRILRSPPADPGRELQFFADTERRSVYAAIPPSTRRRLHRDAARALAVAPANHRDATRIAEHRRLGDPPIWRRMAVAGAAGAALAAIGLLWARTPGAARAEAAALKRVVVVPFANETGDTSLDAVGRMAAEWLTHGVAQSGLARAVPPAFTASAASSAKGADAEALAHNIALGARADLVVWGSVSRHGDSLRLLGRIADVHRGEVLVSMDPVTAEAARPMTGIEALRQTALASLAPHVDPRLAASASLASRPPTFEAYRRFAHGLELFSGRRLDALGHFLDAYALDTTYTLPLLYAVMFCANTGCHAKADSLLQILRPRRERLAPFDRSLLDYYLARYRGDWPAQLAVARAAVQIAPGSLTAVNNLASAAIALNRPREALEALDAIDLTAPRDLGPTGSWAHLASAAHMLGDFARERDVGHLVRRHAPADVRYLQHEVRALAAMGQLDALNAVLVQSLQQPLIPQWGLPGLWHHVRAHDELLAHGHPRTARDVLQRAVDFYRGASEATRADPAYWYDLGDALLRLGALDEARAIFERLYAEHPEGWLGHEAPLLQVYIGVIAARQGDRTRVEEARRWLSGPDDFMHFGQRLEFQAYIAANLGERDEAVRLLQRAAAAGRPFDSGRHSVFFLRSLHGHPGFESWVRPKG